MHDYSGGPRGAAPGKKTVRLAVGRSGSGSVAAETRTITVTLALAADMQFIAWDLPFELREILVKDINGNEYSEGVIVKVKHKVKNFGNTPSIATVTVKDVDTGETVTSYVSTTINPDDLWTSDGVTIGPMPAHDWNLEFTVTP